MLHRIEMIKPLENRILHVIFQNGVEKSFNVRDLYSVFPQFRVFENCDELFMQVTVDVGGYGISWNDELDLCAEDIWENGVLVGEKEIDIVDLLATNLAEARNKAGMTQKSLSEKTGIYQADISKIERGLANPSLTTLKRLAEGLDMQVKIEFVQK